MEVKDKEKIVIVCDEVKQLYKEYNEPMLRA
jgi:hypothetical protein